MRVLALYQSKKTGNTLKVMNALVKAHPEVQLMPVRHAQKYHVNYADYDAVILASGIYFGFPDKGIRKIAETKLSKTQPVFSILTHGSNSDHYKDKWTAALQNMGLNVLGAATCQGYYDMTLLKPFGGMHAGHPNEEEIARVIAETEAALNLAK